MKLPEYLWSTPRLIAVVLTITAVYLAITQIMDVKDFVTLFSLVLGYFFGSRGSEPPTLPKDTTQTTQIQTKTETPIGVEAGWE